MDKEREIRLSRREFNKSMVSAGVLYLSFSNLNIENIREIINTKEDNIENIKDFMVVILKDNELRGFKGFEEIIVTDPDIINNFRNMTEDNNDNKEPLVILIDEHKSIGFKGEEELEIDKGITTELISRFGGLAS